jgi:hypothetical protein
MAEMKCPKCESAEIVFEEIRRMLLGYNVVSDDGENVTVGRKAIATETIDSMGNEDRFRCRACEHVWYLDYAVYEGVEQEVSSEEPEEPEGSDELRSLEEEFARAGGRGVELAERIDALRKEIEPVEQTGNSEEDTNLRSAIGLLHEAADAVSAADPEARGAILSLAESLAESLDTEDGEDGEDREPALSRREENTREFLQDFSEWIDEDEDDADKADEDE